MSKEKRRFSRIAFRVAAEMTVDGVVYHADEILNLSVGGCLLPVQADLTPGTDCEVKIVMSGATSDLNVHIKGKVIRCGDGMAAVQFVAIDPDSLFHLHNIVLYNAQDPEAIEQEIREHPGLV